MQRNLSKVTANRRQYKIKSELFVFIVEMQRNLFKVTANRRQYKIKSELFVDYLAIKHMTLTSITSLFAKLQYIRNFSNKVYTFPFLYIFIYTTNYILTSIRATFSCQYLKKRLSFLILLLHQKHHLPHSR